MEIIGDYLIFNTGKEIYANNGIIGISRQKVMEYIQPVTMTSIPMPTGKFELFELCVTEGCDGGIDINELTKDEKIELADYMIDMWQMFKKEPNNPQESE